MDRNGTMGEQDKLLLKGGEISDFIARITTKALLALGAVFLFAAIKLIRHGNVSDYLFLLAGSILSGAAMMAYAFLSFVPKGKKSFLLTAVVLAGFIPYLFGAYLLFYRGFWRLRELSAEFSMLTILKAACFGLVGYAIVSGIYKVSEFARKVNAGEIIIERGGSV